MNVRQHKVKQPHLEYYSKSFAKKLFALHPEWKQYAGYYAEGEPGALDYFLEAAIPSVNPQVVEPLLIRTHPTEIFIKWLEAWHVHINPWSKQSLEEHFSQALETIDLFVSDNYLFANIYKDGKCVGGWGGRVGTVKRTDMQPKPGQTTVVRSWRGTHDQEF